MDYGTIISKLEYGGYSPSSSDDPRKGNDELEPIDAMEEVVLYALMDTFQVHHNCLLYNRKGTTFHRAGKVQRRKWRAYFDKHVKDRISEGVLSRLRVFYDLCKAERKLTVRARHFQSNFQGGQRVTALAVFDPDTRKIVKQYSKDRRAHSPQRRVCVRVGSDHEQCEISHGHGGGSIEASLWISMASYGGNKEWQFQDQAILSG
jgi:hypothetical protein